MFRGFGKEGMWWLGLFQEKGTEYVKAHGEAGEYALLEELRQIYYDCSGKGNKGIRQGVGRLDSKLDTGKQSGVVRIQ